MKNLKVIGMLMLVLTMVFTATACGATKEETTEATTVATTAQGETQATTEAMAKLDGQVIVDGSGTVYPLMAHIAEEYMTSVQPEVSVQVGRAGSSAGFKKFIPGETDLSDASRKIKDEEVTQLADKGMNMDENVLEIKLAYDGLTIVINKEKHMGS